MMRIIVAVLAFIAICSSGVAKEPFEGPILVPAQVDRVYDADTIYVEAIDWPHSTKRNGARVNGVDTPEKRGTGCQSQWKGMGLTDAQKAALKAHENTLGKEATDLVKGLIKPGDWILLRNVIPGKYAGRVVAEVHFAENIDDLKLCAKSMDFTVCPSLGTMLIEEELAVPYDGGTKIAPWCEVSE